MAFWEIEECRFILLTGKPGIGKTTLIKKICEVLSQRDVSVRGFYTEEVRDENLRIGFDFVTLDGVRGSLARKRYLDPKFRVGQFGVCLDLFDKIAVPTLRRVQPPRNDVLVIDEIGEMGLLSRSFMDEVFNAVLSRHVILATIPEQIIRPLVEMLRTHPLSRVIHVDHSNRDTLVEPAVEVIMKALRAVSLSVLPD